MPKKRKARRTTRRVVSTSKRIIRRSAPKARQAVGIVAAGAVSAGSIMGANFVANRLPVVSGLSQRNKALAQAGAGTAMVMLTGNRWVQLAGVGFVVAGVLNLAKTFPGMETLAGADSEVLTAEELRAMALEASPESMARPVGYLSKPVSRLSGSPWQAQW